MTDAAFVAYVAWLRAQMVQYRGNPQVCRTFHMCLMRALGVPEDFEIPEDRS